MPTDTKRLPVPESSFSVDVFKSSEKETKLFKDNDQRQDGRLCDQIRPIYMKAGVVSKAKGSSYIEMNHTKVICTVYGPRQTKKEDFSLTGQLNCEFKFATFSCNKRRKHQPDNQEKYLSLILLEALQPAVKLEEFPKAQMDVYVMVLQNDGSALAGAITAASVALADAGLEMYDLVVGASLRQFGNYTLLDPTEDEEFHSKQDAKEINNGNITVGLMPSMNQVSALMQNGQLEQHTASEAIKKCLETCQKVYSVVQHCLIESVRKKLDQQSLTSAST